MTDRTSEPLMIEVSPGVLAAAAVLCEAHDTDRALEEADPSDLLATAMVVAHAPQLLESLEGLIVLAEEAIEARKASDDPEDGEMLDVYQARLSAGVALLARLHGIEPIGGVR